LLAGRRRRADPVFLIAAAKQPLTFRLSLR